MKQNLLTKVLLLCALIVGSSSVAWGQEASTTLALSSSTITFEPPYTGAPSSYQSTATNGNLTGSDQNDYVWSFLQSSGSSTKIQIKASTGVVTSPTITSNNGFKIEITYTFSSTSSAKASIQINDETAQTSTTAGTLSAETSSTSATVTITAPGSRALYITKIEITPNAPSYTITPVSSDETMGTVSLSGTTITATPKTGYRVSTSTPYSVNPANSATVVQNGNQFTVTPTANTTITINFEAIPTHTLSSTVSPSAAGTIVLGATDVAEGATTTATATANSGYEFTGWSITGTGATLSSTTDNPTTVTMGTADATVTATFTAVVTHEINWSVNGTIVKTENIKEGNAITFADPESGVPTGYEFIGWTATEIITPQDDDTGITYISSGNSTEDVTYYAVLAIVSGSIETATLTASFSSDDEDSNYADHEYTDNKGYTWKGTNSQIYDTDENVARFGLNKNSGKFESPEFPGNVSAIKMKVYNGSSKNRTFTFYKKSDKTDAVGTLAVSSNTKDYPELSATLNDNAEFTKFYIGASDALGFSQISVTYGNATASNYCTTIPPVTANITDAGYATFSSFTNVDFSDNENLTVFTAKQNGTSITLTEVDSKKVPANTAVILKGEGGDFNGTVVATADALENNDLQIAEEDMNGSSGKIYVLNKVNGVVGFYKLAANGTLTKGKAYLEAESEAPYFGFDGEGTTGILNIERTVIDNQYYTLDGRRVAEPTKGLYIINGKKVVIR